MIEADRERFYQGMATLRSCYARNDSDSSKYNKIDNEYFKQLQRWPMGIVVLAINEAPQPHRFPEKFPFAGQLNQICSDINARTPSKPLQPSGRKGLPYQHVPRTRAAQEQYMKEGATQSERLARYFMCQSVHLGLDPDEPCPIEVARERMKYIMDLLDRHGVVKDMPEA